MKLTEVILFIILILFCLNVLLVMQNSSIHSTNNILRLIFETESWNRNDRLISPSEAVAEQPRLYSYASGSDGEADNDHGKRHSVSSSCSHSSCSCKDHQDHVNEDENTMYASLNDEGVFFNLPKYNAVCDI